MNTYGIRSEVSKKGDIIPVVQYVKDTISSKDTGQRIRRTLVLESRRSYCSTMNTEVHISREKLKRYAGNPTGICPRNCVGPLLLLLWCNIYLIFKEHRIELAVLQISGSSSSKTKFRNTPTATRYVRKFSQKSAQISNSNTQDTDDRQQVFPSS